MTLVIQSAAAPLRVDENGDVRIGKTRVLLDLVVDAFNAGESAESIAEMYSSLELADVYGVIAYYLKHREEIDAYVWQREQLGEVVRKKIERRQGKLKDIRKRLSARGAVAEPGHAKTGK